MTDYIPWLSEFQNLNWPEANLLKIKYSNSSLDLVMTDLIEFQPRLKSEIVEIKINGITDIKLKVLPSNHKQDDSWINVLEIGDAVDEDTFNVFEGIAKENTLNLSPGIYYLHSTTYYWVECWFRASDIRILRTGKYC